MLRSNQPDHTLIALISEEMNKNHSLVFRDLGDVYKLSHGAEALRSSNYIRLITEQIDTCLQVSNCVNPQQVIGLGRQN